MPVLCNVHFLHSALILTMYALHPSFFTDSARAGQIRRAHAGGAPVYGWTSSLRKSSGRVDYGWAAFCLPAAQSGLNCQTDVFDPRRIGAGRRGTTNPFVLGPAAFSLPFAPS